MGATRAAQRSGSWSTVVVGVEPGATMGEGTELVVGGTEVLAVVAVVTVVAGDTVAIVVDVGDAAGSFAQATRMARNRTVDDVRNDTPTSSHRDRCRIGHDGRRCDPGGNDASSGRLRPV
jgi:hypothetical protein